MSPKKLYEKIVLGNHNPSPEEVESLKGTHWHNKLYGGVGKSPYAAFKSFYKETNTGSSMLDRYQMADHVLDSIEDQFGLHFSNFQDVPYDDTKLQSIKDYAMSLLQRCRGNTEDKNDIARRIVNAESVSELLVRLNMLSKNPLE